MAEQIECVRVTLHVQLMKGRNRAELELAIADELNEVGDVFGDDNHSFSLIEPAVIVEVTHSEEHPLDAPEYRVVDVEPTSVWERHYKELEGKI